MLGAQLASHQFTYGRTTITESTLCSHGPTQHETCLRSQVLGGTCRGSDVFKARYNYRYLGVQVFNWVSCWLYTNTTSLLCYSFFWDSGEKPTANTSRLQVWSLFLCSSFNPASSSSWKITLSLSVVLGHPGTHANFEPKGSLHVPMSWYFSASSFCHPQSISIVFLKHICSHVSHSERCPLWVFLIRQGLCWFSSLGSSKELEKFCLRSAVGKCLSADG